MFSVDTDGFRVAVPSGWDPHLKSVVPRTCGRVGFQGVCWIRYGAWGDHPSMAMCSMEVDQTLGLEEHIGRDRGGDDVRTFSSRWR